MFLENALCKKCDEVCLSCIKSGSCLGCKNNLVFEASHVFVKIINLKKIQNAMTVIITAENALDLQEIDVYHAIQLKY